MLQGQGNPASPFGKTIVAALAAATLAIPLGAAAEAPEWRKVDAASGRIADVPGLEKLAHDFPDSASVRRRLLDAYLEAGMNEAALRVALELIRDGYAFAPATRELLLSLGPTEKQESGLSGQDVNAIPRDASRPLATIPAEFQLVESVWRDPLSGDLFATTVVSRALIVSRGGGPWTRVALEGAGSLSGLAYDEAAGLLWIASGVFEQTPEPETAFRGLIAVDPRTGEERRRIAAPADASPGDVAVGPAGEVYVSDPISGAIYIGRPGEGQQLRVLVAAGTFRSPQGIATFSSGSRIVVSDYGYGLAMIDTATGAVRRVALDAQATLDGIDGLWRVGDRLVAVQNGSRPMRIAELIFSRDRETIRAVLYRETANPAWTEPVGGAISGDALVHVATGQWDRFGAGGATNADRPPQPTEIRTMPVGENAPILP